MTWFQDRFEKIKREDETNSSSKIEGLIQELKSVDVEGIHSEVKSSHHPNGGWREDLQDKVAKSVTALANAEGGLVFWGFEDGEPWNPEPITDIKSFYGMINEYCDRCALPSIPGIESIVALKPDGSGYVLTHVPMSDVGPHQANMGYKKTRGKYWVRRSKKCEYLRHYELQDRFGRRPHPCVLPEIVAHHSGSDREPFILDIDLWNRGMGMAKWSSILLRIEPKVSWSEPKKFRNVAGGGILLERNTHIGVYSIYRSVPVFEKDGIIYPEDYRRHMRLLLPSEHEVEMAEMSQKRVWDDVDISWQVFAEGMRSDVRGKFRLTEQMLVRARNGHAIIASFRQHPDWGKPMNPLIPLPQGASGI